MLKGTTTVTTDVDVEYEVDDEDLLDYLVEKPALIEQAIAKLHGCAPGCADAKVFAQTFANMRSYEKREAWERLLCEARIAGLVPA